MAGFVIPLDQWLSLEEKASLKDTLTGTNAAIRDIVLPEYTASIMSNFATRITWWNLSNQYRGVSRLAI